MQSTQFRVPTCADPWRSFLALSVGIGGSAAFRRPPLNSPAPFTSSKGFTARIIPAELRSAWRKAGSVSSAAEGWLWQHRLDRAVSSLGVAKLVSPQAARLDSAPTHSTTAQSTEPESWSEAGVAREAATATEAVRQESTSDSSDSSVRSGGSGEQLCFKAAAACIPHPAKVEKGGEDAYFISDDGLALDGVGAWAEMDIDPGLYSKMLMAKAKHAAERTAPGSDAPQRVLNTAYRETDAKGSCTACIVMLDGTTLRASNLGDSGFLVLRDNRILFQSPTQQHQFNFPYQLGGPESRGDPPEASERYTLGLRRGDVVILATDGVIDNVFPQETASLVSTIHRRGDPPRTAAAGLAQYACYRAQDDKHLSPFAHGAQRAGYQYVGGKVDDITVVVAYVSPASAL